MPYGVSLGRVMEDGVSAAIGLIGAIRATGQGLVHARRNERAELTTAKDLVVRVIVNVTELERLVAHFGQHPRFIGGVNVPIVVVHNGADAERRGGLQVGKRCRKRGENLREQDLCVDFGEVNSVTVY